MFSLHLPPKLFLFAIVMLLVRKNKTNTTLHFHDKNGDLFKSSNELVDSASKELIPKDTTKIDKDGFMNKVFNLLNKHSIGVLCKEKIQINFSKNFQQLYETFCSQLKKGKSIKEAVGNLEKVTEKKEYAIDTTIFGGIRQKIQNLNFLNAKNKDGMEVFVSHFVSAINSFLGMTKGNKLPFVIIVNANNKNGRKSRRTKRADETIITIDSSGNSGGGGCASNGCCWFMFGAIIFTIIFVVFAIYYYSRYHLETAHRTLDFIVCAIFAVICFIATLISCCCACSGND